MAWACIRFQKCGFRLRICPQFGLYSTSPSFVPILSLMLPKATSIRLEPNLQQGLETLSKILKRPMYQLVNEALRDYVSRRSHDVEQDLKETLAGLRAYRRRDPAFKHAIAAAAKAEAQHGRSDPLDGEIVIGELVDDELVETLGPVQTEIHRLLRG
jgi:predicted transcriptional regulator